MSAPTTKTLSPAELAKLEHAFATDPTSEAYKPLAEAYLAMGRFVEALVVCKKGVKAYPSQPEPRVLLARVYADQGKDKKAIEELQGALAVAASDKGVLRLLGSLQLKSGEADAGKSNLLKAFEADPQDGETRQALSQFNIPLPAPPAPPAPAPVAPPPAPVAQAPVQHAQAPRANASVPMLSPVGQQGSNTSLPSIDISLSSHAELPPVRQPPAQAPLRPQPSAPPRAAARPAARPPPAAARRPPPVVDDDDEVEPDDDRPRRSKGGASRAIFFLLIFLVPLAALAYYAIGQYKAVQAREVKALLQQANDLLKADTFASYKQASDAAEKALNKDPTSPSAHSYLAYAYTIRWGEHERADATRQKAEEHLQDAKAGGKEFSHLYAADALFKFYSGQGGEARKELEELVRRLESETKRPALLQLTLGIIQMNEGDLEAAKDTLEKAQGNVPDDPRVYVALGTLHRRRGNDTAALNSFNSALKYTRNSHPEALIGTALLILDQDNPGGGYITAAKYLKTILEATPPPSPRQLALAHFVRAYLVSRVATDLPLYTDRKFQQELQEGTGVSADAAKARSEVTKAEEAGLALNRTNPELFLVRGKRLAFERKLDDAAAEIRKAIEANGQLAHYHVELARVLMRKEGGDKEAEGALRKAVSLVPNSPKLLALLGQVLYRQKKVDEAKSTLEKAVEDAKVKNPEARYLLGRLLRDDKKDYERSVALLEQAAKEYYSDPTNAASAYDNLAQTYELKGDREKARVNYEKALNADKEFTPPYCHYARLLSKSADAKEKEKAREVAKESLRLEPQGECAGEMRQLGAG